MKDENLLHKLNDLLQGERSAAETYQQVLEKVGTDPRADELRRIQSEHLEAVQNIKSQIILLGGKVEEGSGAWGTWAKTMTGAAKLFGDRAALKALKEGEEHGLKQFEEFSESPETDLEPEIKSMINSKYIPRQKAHIQLIDQLMQKIA